MTNAFDRLALAESNFLTSQFLAPVLAWHPVRVRIAGVILSMWVRNEKSKICESKWSILRPITTVLAEFIRTPTLAERQQYLRLFPAVRLILCRHTDDWYGILANADKRFAIAGLAPIHLTEEVQLFDTVLARFDGQTLWFDSVDEMADGRIAQYLREELQKLTEPADIQHVGLTPELRDAYLMAYGPRLEADIEAKRDRNEERLKAVLRRAGADYQSYIERADTFTVEWVVGGEKLRSTVRKDDLGVESAGICLSGGDKNFDLQSLVSVVKEGQRRHQIVRVGDGERMTDDGYWRMYGEREDDDD